MDGLVRLQDPMHPRARDIDIFEDDGEGWRRRLPHRKVYEVFDTHTSELLAIIPVRLVEEMLKLFVAQGTLQAALLERFLSGPEAPARKPPVKIDDAMMPPTQRVELRVQRKSRRKA